jgi:prolyl-tRNA synthetase
MRLSKGFWQTYKETPSDADIPSQQLMLRSGLIYKSGAGLYSYLPMAFKSIKKIEKIIREEMDAINSFEISMPVITPGELWKETGRWDVMGPQMLKFQDRAQRDLCVSPTNEESVTDIFRKTVSSYKQLPVSLYQINTKFRDEIRPRFGLLRGREFTMKDAYSFHLNKESLDLVYEDMYKAYKNIFTRMGLDFIIVEADGGAMASGGARTHEFQLVADNGEDTVVNVPAINYSANIEKAITQRPNLKFAPASALHDFATPNMSTCEDVCKSIDCPVYHSLKSLVMIAEYKKNDGSKTIKKFMVMMLGDDQLNEVKFKNYTNATDIRPASSDELKEMNLIKGYMSPKGINSDIKFVFDQAIDPNASYIVGANIEGFHTKGFVPSRDLAEVKLADLRLASIGDTFQGHPIQFKKGIEVGHVFQLGDKYTKSMKVTVLDDKGQKVTPLMGCYGIGVTRTLAAAIEQSHDENGIIFPASIAPYDIYFAVIGKSEETKNLSEEIYNDLKKSYEVLFDDRGMGPGPMFKDADLLGLPLRIVLGERDYLESGELEIKIRKTGEVVKVKKDNLHLKIKELLEILGKWA